MTTFKTAGSPAAPAEQSIGAETQPSASPSLVGSTSREGDGAAPRSLLALSSSLPVSAAGAKAGDVPPSVPGHLRYESRWCNPCNSRGRLFIDGVCCMASYHEVGT